MRLLKVDRDTLDSGSAVPHLGSDVGMRTKEEKDRGDVGCAPEEVLGRSLGISGADEVMERLTMTICRGLRDLLL